MSAVTDRTLALAAMLQAAEQTRELARRGCADESALVPVVSSLFRFDAEDVAGVFGGAGGLRRGLTLVGVILGRRPGQAEIEMIRYLIGMIQLQRSLMKSDLTQRRLSDELRACRPLDGALTVEHYFAVADIYTRTISLLTPRIIVQGADGNLRDAAVVARVRSALLGGIRAVHLWRQLGGRRWQLLLARRASIGAAARILDDLTGPSRTGPG
jgi:high frequency lysogenization protein